MRTVTLRRALAATLAAGLILAACGDDDDVTTDDPTTSTSADTTTSTSEHDATSTSEDDADDSDDPDAGTIIEVTVSGESIEGGGRHKVSLGDTVTLRVTSDVAEEVHLHGYDLTLDVGAGATADLTFDATIAGVWEAELHPSHRPLLELEIS